MTNERLTPKPKTPRTLHGSRSQLTYSRSWWWWDGARRRSSADRPAVTTIAVGPGGTDVQRECTTPAGVVRCKEGSTKRTTTVTGPMHWPFLSAMPAQLSGTTWSWSHGHLEHWSTTTTGRNQARSPTSPLQIQRGPRQHWPIPWQLPDILRDILAILHPPPIHGHVHHFPPRGGHPRLVGLSSGPIMVHPWQWKQRRQRQWLTPGTTIPIPRLGGVSRAVPQTVQESSDRGCPREGDGGNCAWATSWSTSTSGNWRGSPSWPTDVTTRPTAASSYEPYDRGYHMITHGSLPTSALAYRATTQSGRTASCTCTRNAKSNMSITKPTGTTAAMTRRRRQRRNRLPLMCSVTASGKRTSEWQWTPTTLNLTLTLHLSPMYWIRVFQVR